MYHVGESGVGWDRGWMGQRGYPIEVIVANLKKMVSLCITHVLIRG